jgi:hypothetical protein
MEQSRRPVRSPPGTALANAQGASEKTPGDQMGGPVKSLTSHNNKRVCASQLSTLTIVVRLGARDPRRQTMLRKLMIVLAATAAIGVAAIPNDASAAWRGGGWHGGGWRGGWGGGGWGWGVGAGLLGGALIGGALAAPYYYGYGPYYYGGGPYHYGGCYRTIRVATPYGPRWRRVWVCE